MWKRCGWCMGDNAGFGSFVGGCKSGVGGCGSGVGAMSVERGLGAKS